jgi:P-type Cu+ transporter
MKKFDNMMTKEKDPIANTSITCDCCTELPKIQPVKRRKEEGNEYDDEDRGHIDHRKKRQLFSDKLLIIIGLALTIPTVLLEFLVPHSSTTGFIMLALATPAQVLLGRPFYYRFFQAVKHRKRFTTDTLVVLSTSVAYLYSLFTLLFTSSHVQFFEASTSVLTILQ